MAKLLITSDLHLGDRIWKHKPIEGDSYFSWHQIVQLAITHKVDGVILAGDILDKQVNQSRPIYELFQGLRKLEKAKIPVYFNQGQHEYQDSPWMLVESLANVTWLHNTVLDFHGWKIAGCDYQNEEKLKEFLRSTVALSADILVCHQVWLEFMGEHAKPQGSFADVPKNVRYLVTGDYHDHLVRQYPPRSETDDTYEMAVLSPGSTHLRSLSEPVDKQVFLLDPANGRCPLRSLPLRTRRLFKLHANSDTGFGVVAEQLQQAIDQTQTYASDYGLPEHLRKPVVQLSYTDVSADVLRRVTEQFEDAVHLFFKPISASAAESQQELPNLAATSKASLLGCLDQFVNVQESPVVYSLALALLTAPDAAQALSRWIEEKTND